MSEASEADPFGLHPALEAKPFVTYILENGGAAAMGIGHEYRMLMFVPGLGRCSLQIFRLVRKGPIGVPSAGELIREKEIIDENQFADAIREFLDGATAKEWVSIVPN